MTSTNRGSYKTISNNVEAFDSKGRSVGIIFETSSPFDTPRLMQELVAWTNRELQGTSHHPLLVVAVFIVRYLAIHPFQDGNGRLARVSDQPAAASDGLQLYALQFAGNVSSRKTANSIIADCEAPREPWTAMRSHLMDWLRFFLLCLIEQKDSLAEKVKREKLMSSLSVLDEKLLQLTRQHGRFDANRRTQADESKPEHAQAASQAARSSGTTSAAWARPQFLV